MNAVVSMNHTTKCIQNEQYAAKLCYICQSNNCELATITIADTFTFSCIVFQSLPLLTLSKQYDIVWY